MITESEIRGIFSCGLNETFEDGMDSDFSNSLGDVIKEFGLQALDIIEKILNDKTINSVVIEEALMWIGKVDDKNTHTRRRIILETMLKSPSACIRDASLIGLGSMDDSNSIKSIRSAIENESNDLLKKNLKAQLLVLEKNSN